MKKLYSEFCSRHPKAVKLYKEVLTRDRRLQQFIRVSGTEPGPASDLSVATLDSLLGKISVWSRLIWFIQFLLYCTLPFGPPESKLNQVHVPYLA